MSMRESVWDIMLNNPLLTKKVLGSLEGSPFRPPYIEEYTTREGNNPLNEDQRHALLNILMALWRPTPYVIHGSPGTGKSEIVIEAVLQVLSIRPTSRILICCKNDSLADAIAYQLTRLELSRNDVILVLPDEAKTDDYLSPILMAEEIKDHRKHRTIVTTSACVEAIFEAKKKKKKKKKKRRSPNGGFERETDEEDVVKITHTLILEADMFTDVEILFLVLKQALNDGITGVFGDQSQPAPESQLLSSFGPKTTLFYHLANLDETDGRKNGLRPYIKLLVNRGMSVVNELQLISSRLKFCVSEDERKMLKDSASRQVNNFCDQN